MIGNLFSPEHIINLWCICYELLRGQISRTQKHSAVSINKSIQILLTINKMWGNFCKCWNTTSITKYVLSYENTDSQAPQNYHVKGIFLKKKWSEEHLLGLSFKQGIKYPENREGKKGKWSYSKHQKSKAIPRGNTERSRSSRMVKDHTKKQKIIRKVKGYRKGWGSLKCQKSLEM